MRFQEREVRVGEVYPRADLLEHPEGGCYWYVILSLPEYYRFLNQFFVYAADCWNGSNSKQLTPQRRSLQIDCRRWGSLETYVIDLERPPIITLSYEEVVLAIARSIYRSTRNYRKEGGRKVTMGDIYPDLRRDLIEDEKENDRSPRRVTYPSGGTFAERANSWRLYAAEFPDYRYKNT